MSYEYDYYYSEISGNIRLTSKTPSLFKVLFGDTHIGYLTKGGDKYVTWDALLWDCSKSKFVGAKEGFQVRKDALTWISEHLGLLESL